MRVLLLHPEDDFRGPWTHHQWDSVVDLGRAPKSFYEEWSSALRSPVSSIFDLAVEVEDLHLWGRLLQLGRDRVVDRFGIDWWDVISLMLHPELLHVQLALRLAEKIRGCCTLTATRPSLAAEAISTHLEVPLQLLDRSAPVRAMRVAMRRSAAARNLSSEKLLQVVYDKWDPHYVWRRMLAGPPKPLSSSQPCVLLPSAYSNVTKTAFAYAEVLPKQSFLLVLARESAAVSPIPENVQTARLASFSTRAHDKDELRKLKTAWTQLTDSLQQHPAFASPVQVDIVKSGLRWLRWGVAVRDAWVRVFATRPLQGCLSADDSNAYTRIPLLLAQQRGLPAVACHHGALDCAMIYKSPRFSHYLSKGEMERDYLERVCGIETRRIRLGAPASAVRRTALWNECAPCITLFSEPYETDSWRAETIYRELLPLLCTVARRVGKTVVLKLHPFESLRQRRMLMERVLREDDRKLVTVSDAPLSDAILKQTWCAVTVESTVAVQCAAVRIPAFLCLWLRHAYAGYALQFVRFGVGQVLRSRDEVLRIPEIMRGVVLDPNVASGLVQEISPGALAEALRNPETIDSASTSCRVI